MLCTLFPFSIMHRARSANIEIEMMFIIDVEYDRRRHYGSGN